MVVERRDVWWADLEEPRGSEPGFTRPILIVQADAFNRSRLRTVLGLVSEFESQAARRPGQRPSAFQGHGTPEGLRRQRDSDRDA